MNSRQDKSSMTGCKVTTKPQRRSRRGSLSLPGKKLGRYREFFLRLSTITRYSQPSRTFNNVPYYYKKNLSRFKCSFSQSNIFSSNSVINRLWAPFRSRSSDKDKDKEFNVRVRGNYQAPASTTARVIKERLPTGIPMFDGRLGHFEDFRYKLKACFLEFGLDEIM